MNATEWFWTVVEAVIWYFFIYYLLFAVQNEVNLWTASLVLLVLAYLGTITCPWFRKTDAWKRLWGKEQQ
jgi:hypothetical protein